MVSNLYDIQFLHLTSVTFKETQLEAIHVTSGKNITRIHLTRLRHPDNHTEGFKILPVSNRQTVTLEV
jgi:hypothetical protein